MKLIKLLNKIYTLVKKKERFFGILTLILVVLLASRGLNWGRVEYWNPDERAHASALRLTECFFCTWDYFKPPFYNTTHYFLVILPIDFVSKIIPLSVREISWWNVWITGFFNLIFFCLAGLMIYLSLKKILSTNQFVTFGTLLFLSSAGLQTHIGYATVDIFLLMWSAIATYLFIEYSISSNKKMLWLSALAVGLTAAAKYNGLSLIILILITILQKSFVIRKNKDRLIFIVKQSGSVFLMTALGFLLGAPAIISDFSKFIGDFWLNVKITPGYHEGYSYLGYFLNFFKFKESVGWPILLSLLIGIAVSWKAENLKIKTILISSFVFWIVNYLFFGAYYDSPPRFFSIYYQFFG